LSGVSGEEILRESKMRLKAWEHHIMLLAATVAAMIFWAIAVAFISVLPQLNGSWWQTASMVGGLVSVVAGGTCWWMMIAVRYRAWRRAGGEAQETDPGRIWQILGTRCWIASIMFLLIFLLATI
jgi:hypothetical protein